MRSCVRAGVVDVGWGGRAGAALMLPWCAVCAAAVVRAGCHLGCLRVSWCGERARRGVVCRALRACGGPVVLVLV